MLRDHQLGRSVLREVLSLIFLFRKVLRDWQYRSVVPQCRCSARRRR
ncbi:MAG: hypothetical protein R3B99_28755 [Polyangiales bacterium]